uniref:EF-hand domain-containing protein n=1 Tax=Ciona savignyi TaxID=51511 RepID=H2ZFS3_CIOSA
MIDENGDGELDENELSKWVLHKTKEHFEEAKLASEHKFNELDNDKDGSVSWNEYLVEFLGRRNFNRQEVAQKLHDKVKIEVDKKLREEIDDAHDKWLQASRDGDPDMSVAEFRDFQHPETGREMLEYLVQEFLHDMDTDGDEVLTVQEYISVGSDVDVDTQDDDWAKERRTEFRNVIDQNSDGKVTKAELKVTSLSEGMALQEARQLIGFGDENTDFKLSLSELLENSEYYTGSKLYNYARSVHDDL